MLQSVTQAPALHAPLVPHDVPSAKFVHALSLVPGWQLWQLLAGFFVLVV